MDAFLETYKKLSRENISLLNTIYAEDITFIDPAHKIEGLENLRNYFENLYENVTSINFDFSGQIRNQDEGYVQWKMSFSHPKLKRGEIIIVDGASFLQFSSDNKVHYHRDYFDLTSMLHQHLPLVGPLVKLINRRIGS